MRTWQGRMIFNLRAQKGFADANDRTLGAKVRHAHNNGALYSQNKRCARLYGTCIG